MITKLFLLQNRKPGFASAAALMVMTVSLTAILTLMYRSAMGQSISISGKQSTQTYQKSDESAELMLQDMRKVDRGTYNATHNSTQVDASKKIAENIVAYYFCRDHSVTCYYSPGGTETRIDAGNVSVDLDQVTAIQSDKSSTASARSIKLSPPERVTVPETTVTTTLNGRNVVLSWTAISGAAQDEIEVRRAMLDTATRQNASAFDNLHDAGIDWTRVGNLQPLSATSITDNNVPSGKYIYTLKVVSHSPFKRDSIYLLPTSTVTVP